MKLFALLRFYYATLMIFVSMTFMIIIFPFLPRPYAQKVGAWVIRLLIFIPVNVKGKIDPDVQMLVLNHQSDVDIGVMETITKKDLAWVAKKELFDVPFFGLMLKLPKDIPVERESKSALIKLLKDAKDRLDDGRVITIFPEGTRSSGKKMLPFKAGAKILADKYSLRVQPLVLINTAHSYNSKTKQYNPGAVTVVYMDAFDVDKSDKEWYKNLRDSMQKVYDDELANTSSNR
ncbi:MAG: lysophospholipid acyltransferase family protein [Campylobacterota bacterium]|nr:lysophospholipid acyltransferase family protein [Campylobacterota bacterium]